MGGNGTGGSNTGGPRGGGNGVGGTGNSGNAGASGAMSTGGAPPPPPPNATVVPGGWKCPSGVTGVPTLEGATPTRVVGVPPVDGFSSDMGFASGILEGPVWIGDALYLSELSTDAYDETDTQVKRSRILRVGSDDSVSVAIADSGSNGLAVDGAGNLLAAVHKNGSITRFALPDGATGLIATNYAGTRFDSPNDLAMRSDGNLYFTDPSYQAPLALPQTDTRVYRVTPPGEVVPLVDIFVNPNGVTVSLGEDWLYVGARMGRRYPLAADGSVGVGEDFAPTSGIDGITLDCAGNLYVARNQNVVVYDAAGTLLGSVRVPEVQSVTNLAFGGADRKTLYITGLGPRKGLFKLTLELPGRPY
jgi:gluconolactonase